MSENLSGAGSTVTYMLRLIQLPHNSIWFQTRQKNKAEFNINILDVVFPLSTLSTHSQKALVSFSTSTCSSKLLNPMVTFQNSFYLPCHHYLTYHSPLLERKPCLLGFQDTHQSLLLCLLPHFFLACFSFYLINIYWAHSMYWALSMFQVLIVNHLSSTRSTLSWAQSSDFSL